MSSGSQIVSETRAPSAGRCLLCGSTGGRIVVRESTYLGRACDCGIVYIDPEPPSGAVDPSVDHHFDSYYALPAARRLDWVRRFMPEGRLLEVGCGTGHFLAKAQAHGYEVVGIDPNPESADEVRRTLGIEVEEALIEESSQLEGSFDVVFHVDLLSHFPDPVRALRAMAEKLRPGGVLCFEVGVFGGLTPGWYRWIGRVGYPQHRWLFSEAAIETLLDRAGLRIEGLKRFGLLPATVLSTLGNTLMRSRIPRKGDRSGRAMRARGLYRIYNYLQFLLRYQVGAVVPPFGPHALFVTARPRSYSAPPHGITSTSPRPI